MMWDTVGLKYYGVWHCMCACVCGGGGGGGGVEGGKGCCICGMVRV